MDEEKKSRFTKAQIMGVPGQPEGRLPVPELRREHEISSATFYKWRAKYGGMDASMMSQMKALRMRTGLKHMFADLSSGRRCTSNQPRPHSVGQSNPADASLLLMRPRYRNLLNKPDPEVNIDASQGSLNTRRGI